MLGDHYHFKLLLYLLPYKILRCIIKQPRFIFRKFMCLLTISAYKCIILLSEVLHAQDLDLVETIQTLCAISIININYNKCN